MPKTEDEITRGDRYELRVTLTQGGTALNLVALDFTPFLQIRRDLASVSPDAVFDAVVSGASNNVVDCALPATTTLALLAGETYYGRMLLQHATDPGLDQVTRREYVFTVIESAARR